MHLSIRSLLPPILVVLSLSHISPAAGASIPRRISEKQTRDAYETSKLAEINGLDRLRTYVCPDHANNIKRQASDTNETFTNSAIPLSQIPLLWTELQLILADLGAVLRAGGYLDPTAVAAALSLITLPSILISSFDVSSTLTLIDPPVTITSTSAASPTSTYPSATLISSIAVSTPTGLTGSLENERAAIDESSCPPAPTTTTVVETIILSLIPINTSVPFNEIGAGSEFTSNAVRTVTLTLDNVAASSTASSSVNVLSTIASVVSSSSTTTSAATQPGGIYLETSTGYMSRTAQPTPSASSYVFNAESQKNIAVYFGQTPVTGMTNLSAQCADTNIDIVIVAFVVDKTYLGKYPLVNFGAACGGQTSAMISEAPGLLSCPSLAADIKTCQETYGKKVLLSVGGSTSSISFQAPSEAVDFANVLWDLFGPPGNVDIELRPFGNITIDGFDIDAEDREPANWGTVAATLRANFATTNHKQFYISSAPQCPFPDASTPLPLLLACDFVFVQFYNNPQCEIGSPGFTASLQQWSAALAAASPAKLFLGAPSFNTAGPAAYAAELAAGGIQDVVRDVALLGLGNFGGVMFWDGPEGRMNVVGGKDVLAWAKLGLDAA